MSLKSQLSKINFWLGRTPQVLKVPDFRKFIPSPFKTIVLFSADFELAWAPRYDKQNDRPLEYALRLAKQERKNIPEILELCDKYGIPITWATVGHLFLDQCDKHPEMPQVPKYQGRYWDFSGTDWYEYDPASDLKHAPEWYAPDLLKLILDSETPHEIGCHTFSHIDCRDEVCPEELLQAELNACQSVASDWQLSLKSFVHPGHTIGHLNSLKNAGFTSFRTDYRNLLGYPKNHGGGLWELQQTAEIQYRQGWSSEYHAKRYIEIIKRAISSNTVCVFWFHPSFDPRVTREILPEVLDFLDNHRQEIWITTHGRYCDFLNQNQN
ncbi:MAG: polysaccharide deacetylase [Bacteroidetes bacterium]|nr:MAG: polysaccharide deacetylase [Bacteroidota bacterium]